MTAGHHRRAGITAIVCLLAIGAVRAELVAGADDYAQARIYSGLTGAKLDRGKAFTHTRKAAEAGHVPAQVDLAFLYFNGNEVVMKDRVAARHWFKAAAEAGSVPAQCMLGDFHRDGVGGARQDPREAFKWYLRSAGQPDRCAPKAQYELYASYASGRGVEKDMAKAMSWLRRSADAGNPQAQRTLGRAYAQGQGVERDERLASLWFRKSREGVAPHDDHDHSTPKCPPWLHEALQKKAGCAA